jgi:hypothetical protein
LKQYRQVLIELRDPLSRPYKKKGAPTCARAPELPNPVDDVLLPFLGNFFLVLLALFLHSNFLLRFSG